MGKPESKEQDELEAMAYHFGARRTWALLAILRLPKSVRLGLA
jgi:hypothetical protein